ncbi:MAG: family 20 glycosylhydrolase [Bacteroidales bacterium]|nr:family 20 glycosylhydrolase [Bacteroidales bacterium]HOI32398.1 family 20 glycosylhydrolase [Bacteroidales bacterium]
MKKLFWSLLVGVILVSTSCEKSENPRLNIIPQPERMFVSDRTFKLNQNSRIIFEDPNPALRLIAEELAQFISSGSSFQPEIMPYSLVKSIENDIYLSVSLNDSLLGDDGYQMKTNNGQFISIQANTARGVFYGVQSLYQLFPDDFYDNEIRPEVWKLPAVTIKDRSRFAYRGMHLDVCRHIFPVEFIKQYIDLLAMYKYNHLHWHLTDDQGWRIEIKAFPGLTEVGAWRNETLTGHGGASSKVYDEKPYGGFYTQDEIREIVDYAALRYITIIPEIEMPGHASAALAAYPDLGCTGGPYKVETSWGVFEDIFCTKEETFSFLQQVLDEVMELFPSKYIHIGGDEAPKTRWKTCKTCQQKIKTENLADEHELQSWFVHRIEKYLNQHGRKIIGWDEILEGGLAPDATVMSWRGTAGGIEAARQGHDVIMTPVSHCYFDYYQGDPAAEPLAFGGYTPVSKVYTYEPVPEELNEKQAKHILGAQANLWSEYLKKPENVTYMALPRMAALSEVLWSPSKSRDWENFYDKLPSHFQRYEALGLNYSKAVNQIAVKEISDPNGEIMLDLKTEVPSGQIYFTTDGSEPDTSSNLFEQPIEKAAIELLKMQLYRKGQKIGETQQRAFKRSANE